jgi:hypothetical protein
MIPTCSHRQGYRLKVYDSFSASKESVEFTVRSSADTKIEISSKIIPKEKQVSEQFPQKNTSKELQLELSTWKLKNTPREHINAELCDKLCSDCIDHH